MAEKPHMTHVALYVNDIRRAIAFYQKYAGFHLVHDREDGGTRVVWLSEKATDPEFVFVLIGVPHAESLHPAPLAHFGFACASRSAVDNVARMAAEEEILISGPVDQGPIVGYYCIMTDPEGNLVEFSHGQPINPKQFAD